MGQKITFKRPNGAECNGYLASPAEAATLAWERTTEFFAKHVK